MRWTFLLLVLMMAVPVADRYHRLSAQSIPDFSRAVEPEGTDILKENTISDIAEDPRGFIWIAAYNGLYRYDGTELIKMHKGSFSDIQLNKKTQQMAFVHHGGVYIFHYDTEKEIHIAESEIGRLYNQFSSALFDTDTSLLIGHNEGFTRYHLSSQTSVFHPLKNVVERVIGVSDIAIDPDSEDRLWIGTNSGLFRYHLQTGEQKQYRFKSKITAPDESINVVTRVVPHQNGKIYLGTWHGGVVIFDKKEESYRQMFVEDISPHSNRPPSDHIYRILTDGEDRLWFSSTVGTMLYDVTSDSVLYHEKGVTSTQRLDKGPQLIDSRSHLWCGYDHGLTVVNPTHSGVRTMRSPQMNNDHVYILRKVIRRDDLLYFCVLFSDGLYTYDLIKSEWNLIVPNDYHLRDRFDATDMVVSNDTLWILESAALYFQALGSGSLREYPLNYEQIDYHFTSMIRSSKSEFLLQSRDKGIFIADLSNHSLRPYHELHQLHPNLLIDRGSRLLSDDHKNIWIATNQHLWVKKPDSEDLIDLTPGFGFPTGRRPDLYALYEEGESIWIGGHYGLWRCSMKNPTPDAMEWIYEGYTNHISHIDSMNAWWVSGHHVIHLDRQTGEITKYNENNGLVDAGRNGYDAMEWIEDDAFVLGGRGIYSMFQPVQLVRDSTRSIPYFTSISVNGVPVEPDSGLFNTGEIQLSAGSNTVNFQFSGIGFDNARVTGYRYKFDDVDTSWQQAGPSSRNTTYSHLGGGDYRFHLQTIGANDIESNIRTIDIDIATPILKRPWVQVCGALLFLLSFYWFYTWRINRIKKDAAMQTKLTQLERKALQSQMDPHFIFNAMNSIQHLISADDDVNAMRYLNNFSKLLRTVLHIASKDYIPLSDEIMILENYIELEQLRLHQKFSYKFDIEASLTNENLLVPPMMIQPFVENAIQHGLADKVGDCRLTIIMKDREDSLYCAIEDNGIGRAAAKQNRRWTAQDKQESKGIGLVHDRLNLYSSDDSPAGIRVTDLHDAANIPSGTRVEIVIPIKPRIK